MNIPDNAIEAARDLKIKEGEINDYAVAHGIGYREALWRMRLEVAAPLIAAQALRDAADESERLKTNAHEWLRDRADELDPQ